MGSAAGRAAVAALVVGWVAGLVSMSVTCPIVAPDRGAANRDMWWFFGPDMVAGGNTAFGVRGGKPVGEIIEAREARAEASVVYVAATSTDRIENER